jgi:hypothetical protein
VNQSTVTRARSETAASGIRRIAVRVPADFSVVVARQGGEKVVARVTDISVTGMHLVGPVVPEYGEQVTIVFRFSLEEEWLLQRATVRWFSKTGFGVEFHALGETQASKLARFVRSVSTR